MKKITYHKEGDYLIPDLTIKNDNKNYHIGKYGNLKLNFIKNFKRGLYTELKMSGELKNPLMDVDKQAVEEINKLIKEIAKAENVSPYFDAHDAMTWVGLMNNIKDRAEEIVLNEIIYV